MPAFSHCFLKRFIAFSNDSPSLTRTPGILGITTLRGAHEYPRILRDAGVYAPSRGCQSDSARASRRAAVSGDDPLRARWNSFTAATEKRFSVSECVTS